MLHQAAVNFAHFYRLSLSRNIWKRELVFPGYLHKHSWRMPSQRSWMVAYSENVCVVAATAFMMKNRFFVPDRALEPDCNG